MSVLPLALFVEISQVRVVTSFRVVCETATCKKVGLC